jgi:hypothetical protein
MLRRVVMGAIALASFLPVAPAAARPAEIFEPYLPQIQQSLPPGHVMRLPSQVRLGSSVVVDPQELIVRVFPARQPATMTVSLFACETGAYPCLVGSFSSMRANDPTAQQELSRHQAMATSITLKPGIQGFLREGARQAPASNFSSVMWQQDGMIYTVSFLAHERQNILNMALSMANDIPIRRASPLN